MTGDGTFSTLSWAPGFVKGGECKDQVRKISFCKISLVKRLSLLILGEEGLESNSNSLNRLNLYKNIRNNSKFEMNVLGASA